MRPTDHIRAGFGEKCMCCKSRKIRDAARRECEDMVYGARDPKRMKRMQTYYDSSAKRIQKYILQENLSGTSAFITGCWDHCQTSTTSYTALGKAVQETAFIDTFINGVTVEDAIQQWYGIRHTVSSVWRWIDTCIGVCDSSQCMNTSRWVVAPV